MKQERRATVQETANLYEIRHGRAASTPALTLRGQWLAAAGFPAGITVTVHLDAAGRLIIERNEHTPPEATP